MSPGPHETYFLALVIGCFYTQGAGLLRTTGESAGNSRRLGGLRGKQDRLWESLALGDKQGLNRHRYGEFIYLGFPGREGEMPPSLSRNRK